jgi:hypothetical protein
MSTHYCEVRVLSDRNCEPDAIDTDGEPLWSDAEWMDCGKIARLNLHSKWMCVEHYDRAESEAGLPVLEEL